LKAILADVGLADLGELKTLVQQKRAVEEANKSELAKAQERAAQLEKQLAEAAYLNRLKRRLLVITNMLLKDIAPAASMGLRKPAAAAGMRMTL